MIIRLHGITVNHDAVASFIGNGKLTPLKPVSRESTQKPLESTQIYVFLLKTLHIPTITTPKGPKSLLWTPFWLLNLLSWLSADQILIDCTAKAVMHRLTKLEVLGNQYDAELTAIKEIVANRARAAGTPRCFAAAAPKSKATKTTTASAAAKEETGGAVKGRVGGVKRASAVEGEKGTPIKRARFHDAALKKTHIEMNDEDEEMMESDDAEDEERGSE
ncbi:hypothetical protein MMC21_003955 [Puttea exsequens]|nr:hypothetical protein [Puttea exsequens]